jgi:predicted HAD superfamily Cof-like phosphohydrolase
MTSKFHSDIVRFNAMYGMAVNKTPTIPFITSSEKGTARNQLLKRLSEFKAILLDEVKEVDELVEKIKAGEAPLDILVDLADWLGDIQVFCASEMMKFGLDNDLVLSTIMASNFSKLQADGSALFIEDKLQKGPNYWKPEPKLKKYFELINASKDAEETS